LPSPKERHWENKGAIAIDAEVFREGLIITGLAWYGVADIPNRIAREGWKWNAGWN